MFQVQIYLGIWKKVVHWKKEPSLIPNTKWNICIYRWGRLSNHKTEDEKRSSIYDYIDYKYEELQARGIEEEELELLIENDVQSFFVQYFNQISKNKPWKCF